MDEAEAVFFRDQLREARAEALHDAEGYLGLLYCFERLGSRLYGKIGDLGKYGPDLRKFARPSPLAEDLPGKFPQCHTPFDILYDSVKNARNDALHQGAVARHLTRHAIELALILEGSLMDRESRIGSFMVRNPVCAQPWQPLSFLRQTMLVEAFSYLPVRYDFGGGPIWYLVSDYGLARFLRGEKDLKMALAKPLCEVLNLSEPDTVQAPIYEVAPVCNVDDPIDHVLQISKGKPVLICQANRREVSHADGRELVGIITPFDLM